MLSGRPPTRTLNDLRPSSRTLYGPRYAGLRAGAAGGARTYTKRAPRRRLASGPDLMLGRSGEKDERRDKNSWVKYSGGCSWAATKTPGSASGAPYTISAEETPLSSLGLERSPSRTQGR
jgi:hypothetical protein